MLLAYQRAALGVLLAAGAAAADTREYAVDSEASRITVHVGKTGVFGFAGHEHEVKVGRLSGTVSADDASLAASSVTLEIEAASLAVTGQGESAGDVAQVQTRMLGPEVLDTAAHPTIA